jgi:hypothetical protein
MDGWTLQFIQKLKIGMGCSSVQQVQGSEFDPQHCKRINKKKYSR